MIFSIKKKRISDSFDPKKKNFFIESVYYSYKDRDFRGQSQFVEIPWINFPPSNMVMAYNGPSPQRKR